MGSTVDTKNYKLQSSDGSVHEKTPLKSYPKLDKKTHSGSYKVSLHDISVISDDMNKIINMSPSGILLEDGDSIKDGVKITDGAINNLSNADSRKSLNRYQYVSGKPIMYDTSDNNSRKELLWTEKIEGVIRGWHDECIKIAHVHGKCAKYHTNIFYGIGIPASIFPLMLAALNDTLKEEPIVTIVLLISTGVLTTVNGFLNPGKRAEAHRNYEAMYNELAVEITCELVKPQSYRQDADVFIQKIMDRFNSLNNRAPPI